MLDDIVNVIAPLYNENKIVSIVDVFGGSGNVIINIPVEWNVNRVYNDLDSILYKTMLTLQDPKLREELYDKLTYTLNSRELFKSIKAKSYDEWTAYDYIYTMLTCHNGDLSQYGVAINQPDRLLTRKIDNVIKNSIFLKNIKLENLDFEKLIEKYKSPRTLFYCDPPYLAYLKKYKIKFSKDDMFRLYNILADSNSYYLLNEVEQDFNDINDIFGMYKFTKKYRNSVVRNRNQLSNSVIKSYRTEGFWFNF